MQTPKGIEVVDDAFGFGADVIAWLNERDSWARSEVGVVASASDVRTSSTQFAPWVSYGNPEVIHNLGKTMYRLITNYAAIYGVQITSVEPMAFNRYEPGQRFGLHTDDFPGGGRAFSAVAYLNTVSDGGGTRFPHFGLEVPAVAGRVVLFPSNFLFAHEGVAPVHETKYSAAFWIHG